MTVEQIYSKLANHMLQGVMMHEQLANYYDFLGLGGYKRCHEYHFYEESCAYRYLCRYFINNHNKLIPDVDPQSPNVIPESWYRYTRQDVDTNTKRNAVKSGMNTWVEWEKRTKKLYEGMYKELMDIEEVASAFKVKELICDVDRELKKAERYQLNKAAIDYDLSGIVAEQEEKHDKYKHKLCKLFLDGK